MADARYILILLVILLFAFFLHKKFKIKVFRNYKHWLYYSSLMFFLGLVWDYYSVSQGIWIFPIGNTLGVRIGVLPIEEYMFFLIVPYFGVVAYKLLEDRLLT